MAARERATATVVVALAVASVACSESSARDDGGRRSDVGAPPRDGGSDVREDDVAPVPRVCGADVACDDQGCPCAGDLTCCDGACVDTRTDPANCGACGAAYDGSACPGCEGCRSGETCCGPVCVNTDTDPENCGVCGVRCPEGGGCVRGECHVPCSPELDLCGDACVDTRNAPDHCGGCGHACGAGQVCAGGSCECPDPLIECGGECVNPQSSNDHCGRCWETCVASEICLAGVCTGDCFFECRGACGDWLNDPSNCGACGEACSTGQVCDGGTCTCPSGTRACGPRCVALDDARHCGACDRACAAGERCLDTPSGGVCAATAPTGLTIECSRSGVVAGGPPFPCGALLANDDGTTVLVTRDPETTWSIAACRSDVCGTADASTVVSTGESAGWFTPAGQGCPRGVATTETTTLRATWTSGAVTLVAEHTMTVAPALSLGLGFLPADGYVPWLFDARCASATGLGTGGIVVVPTLVERFAWGAHCPVEVDEVTVTTSDPRGDVLGVIEAADGRLALTPLRAPRLDEPPFEMVVRAFAAGLESASATLAFEQPVRRHGLDAYEVPSPDATAIQSQRLVVTSRSGVSDITTLGDARNLAPSASTDTPWVWNCSGAIDASRTSPLYPWTEMALPFGVELIGSGAFRATAAATSGAYTPALTFPYVGALDAIGTAITMEVP